MPHIEQFVKNLLKPDLFVDVAKYSDEQFCADLQKYCLERIKFILLNILSEHLPHEHVGSEEPFYLSAAISAKDYEGFNMLDYCILAGLNEQANILAKLGCKPTLDVELVKNKLRLSESAHKSQMLNNISITLQSVKSGMQEHSAHPLEQKEEQEKSWFARAIHRLKNFPYHKAKLPLLLLLGGAACCIAGIVTLFTGPGAIASILLFSLGVPAIISGAGDMQATFAAVKNYQQVELNSRVLHEAEMLKTLHKEVCHEIKILHNAQSETKVHVKHAKALNTEQDKSILLYTRHDTADSEDKVHIDHSSSLLRRLVANHKLKRE